MEAMAAFKEFDVSRELRGIKIEIVGCQQMFHLLEFGCEHIDAILMLKKIAQDDIVAIHLR